MDRITSSARTDQTIPGPTPVVASPAVEAYDPERREFGQRLSKRRRQLARTTGETTKDLDDIYEPDAVITPDPTQPLMEALERLRITSGATSSDPETGRILRGRRAYQEQTTRVVIPA